MASFESTAFDAGGFDVAGAITPAPDFGDYAESHKKSRKRRDAELAREKEEKERLRQIIAEAIDPTLKQAETVDVVASEGAVQIVPSEGKAMQIPVSDLLSLAEAARVVMEALERAQIVTARLISEAELEQRQETERRRIAKRKRDDELLMLMD